MQSERVRRVTCQGVDGGNWNTELVRGHSPATRSPAPRARRSDAWSLPERRERGCNASPARAAGVGGRSQRGRSAPSCESTGALPESTPRSRQSAGRQRAGVGLGSFAKRQDLTLHLLILQGFDGAAQFFSDSGQRFVHDLAAVNARGAATSGRHVRVHGCEQVAHVSELLL